MILRIISPSKEYLEISKDVVSDNKNLDDNNIENIIQSQYSNLLSSSALSILRFPYIIDLISILGDSNISHSDLLLNGLLLIKPSFSKEISTSLLESYQVCLKY